MNTMKSILNTLCSIVVLASLPASAAILSHYAEGLIPRDVQQLIVLDYRSMHNEPAATNLEKELLPRKLETLVAALTTSGLDIGHATDTKFSQAFAARQEHTPSGLQRVSSGTVHS